MKNDKLLAIKIRISLIIFISIFISILFGLFYFLLYHYKVDSFNFRINNDPTSDINWNIINEKNSLDFWYFSWLNQLTVGYGQIFPVSDIGKILSIIQIFLFWIFILSLSIIIDEENILNIHKLFI